MKLVKESISFVRHEDPYKNAGVGSEVPIRKWLDKMGIINYEINPDFTIDVNEDTYLSFLRLTQYPDYIQFNIIKGRFSCMNNDLISLKGCPRIVKNDFICSYNKLISLEGCPEIVEGKFYCQKNEAKFTEEYVRSLCKVKRNIIL